jgi:hypothetical protein
MTLNKMDAVLPLTLKDFDRFRILQKSLDAFCKNLLNIIWVVVPDHQLQEIREQIGSGNYQVIPESFLVPEIKLLKIQGWYLQQLIKLAIANHVKTDFYLTLDADIICTQSVHHSDLVKEGRAVYSANSHSRYDNEFLRRLLKTVLKLDPLFVPRHNYYNVTPAVLSRDAVLQLQQYLRRLSIDEFNTSLKLVGSKKSKLIFLGYWLIYRCLPKRSSRREQIVDYKGYLLRNTPWTEYTLYYNFCDSKDLLDQYHILTPHCIYAGENSVWKKDQLINWQPENCFEGDRNFFFCVFQSNTEIPAEVVLEKVEKFLQVNTD